MGSRANMNGFFCHDVYMYKNDRFKTVFMQPSNQHVKLSDMIKKTSER